MTKAEDSRASVTAANESIVGRSESLMKALDGLDTDEKIATMNAIKQKLHDISPFKAEPVDCVIWVKTDFVAANDYNPNTVAPPEMKLLAISIGEDGYTQPIVSWDVSENGEPAYEVIDGFHRNRVAREVKEIGDRVMRYLPLTVINDGKEDRGDRIASTIRHNRARGKHGVEAMAEIVLELKRRNWSDAKIGRDLGMDPDEVLRLAQITGLAEMFKDHEFTQAWEVEDLRINPGAEDVADMHVLPGEAPDEISERLARERLEDSTLNGEMAKESAVDRAFG